VRVGVVGAGVSGLVAAYLLSRAHEVELLERNAYFGGHSNTVAVKHEGQEVGLDTGFIVYNQPAYPRFAALLAELGVATQASDMSFSVSCRACGIEYSSRGVAGWLARPRGHLRRGSLLLARDVLRFYRNAPRDMESSELAGATLSRYLQVRRYSDEFRRHFIVPLAAAVWSMPPGEVETFPAQYLLRFLYNHGLIGGGKGRWRWRSVSGGSRAYVKAITDRLGCAARVNAPVAAVRRCADGVDVCLADGRRREYDAIVLACHADEALALLADASPAEEAALGAFAYTRNQVILHTDAGLLPGRRAARASWNYLTRDCRRQDGELALTYHLNRLQSIWNGEDYCVSVNAQLAIDAAKVVSVMTYDHPRYTFRTLEGQRGVEAINGRRRTFFVGAHLGYGFHEDGVASAYRVAAMLGVQA
jgi:predicted NAD/FAD-binding protein